MFLGNSKEFLTRGRADDAERPKLSDRAHEGVGLQPGRDGGVRCSAWLGVRFIVWKRDSRAFADTVPFVVELERLVLLRLEPETGLAVLLAFVGEVANLCGCEHEALRCVECDVAADDEEVSQKSFELAAERNWAALRKRLHLDGVSSGGVLAVDKDV